MDRLTLSQLDQLRTLAHAAGQRYADARLDPNTLLALLTEVELLRQVLADARNSYAALYHPVEEGNLSQAIATYDRRFFPKEPADETP